MNFVVKIINTEIVSVVIIISPLCIKIIPHFRSTGVVFFSSTTFVLFTGDDEGMKNELTNEGNELAVERRNLLGKL